ncbi:MAG: hypothetical protein HQ592_05065 [Planctomycetes bacterium]|nr:hypothetical protein [Planctomycetota bacterium]
MVRSCVITVSVCAAALLATGCVSTEKHELLTREYQQSQKTVGARDTEIASLKGTNEGLSNRLLETQGKLVAAESEKAALAGEITAGSQKITDLNANIEALNKKIEGLEENRSNMLKTLGSATTEIEQGEMKLKTTRAQLKITQDKLKETEDLKKKVEKERTALEARLAEAASRFGECIKEAQIVQQALKSLMTRMSHPLDEAGDRPASAKPNVPPAAPKEDAPTDAGEKAPVVIYEPGVTD